MIRAALLLPGVLFLIAAAEKPSPPQLLPPAEGMKQGKALVAEILAQKPNRNVTNSGVLLIRNAQRKEVQVPIEFSVAVTSSNWLSSYQTKASNQENYGSFTVVHAEGRPNEYLIPNRSRPPTDTNEISQLASADLMTPFAGSDFWLVDLALDFLQWPEQRLLKSEMRRSRSCRVLESKNPKPAPGAYSRVVSWIDNESGGIVHADALDAKGRLLKEFDPKDFKKVNGEWQLEEMEIRNSQTGTLTRIQFQFGQ